MANPTITNSSYAGEFAGKYLGAALLSASTSNHLKDQAEIQDNACKI